MPLRFFTATRTGEIQSRLTNDVGGVQGVVINTATTIVSNLSTVLSTIIAMAFISPLLTLISLGLHPFFLWITYKVGTIRRTTSKGTQQSMAWSPPPSLLLLPTNRMFQDHGNQDPHDEPILQEGTHNSWNTVKRSRRYRH